MNRGTDMSTLPENLDYSDKDFESLRARMFDLIRSVFPTWTADAVANFGNILVESFCFTSDVLTFYQDQQAREGRFKYVQLRKNVIALSKLINYELDGAEAATADLVLTVTNPEQLVGTVVPSSTPVVVGTRSVTNPVKGEIQGALSFDIEGGETEKTVGWEHSLTQPKYIVASTGAGDQRILAPFGPFLVGSDIVSTVDQGVFTKVDSFFTSGPNDAHYRIEVDQNDRALFIYGDGKNGIIPTGNITHEYKTGGGTVGNVESGSLSKIEGSFVDSVGNKAFVTSVNNYEAEGGIPREEVASAKENAPLSLRVLNRTVAREDYEINAKRVPSVGRALMLTSNEDVTINENRGKLFVIPKTGGTPSQAILDEVYTMVTDTYPNTITFQLEVLAAVYKVIDVRAVIYLKQNITPSTAKAAVIAALEDYFEPMLADGTQNPNVDFGYNYKDEDGNPAGEIAWSDVQNVVRDLTTYIRKVDAGSNGFTLNGLRSDVTIPNWMFPALGQVTVINGDTGTEI
jgi:hypothetical protein